MVLETQSGESILQRYLGYKFDLISFFQRNSLNGSTSTDLITLCTLAPRWTQENIGGIAISSNIVLDNEFRYDVQKQGTISLLYSATTGDVTALRRFHAQVKNK